MVPPALGQEGPHHQKGAKPNTGDRCHPWEESRPQRAGSRGLGGRRPTEDKVVCPRGLREGSCITILRMGKLRPGAGHLGEAKHVLPGSGLPTLLGFQPEAIPAIGGGRY